MFALRQLTLNIIFAFESHHFYLDPLVNPEYQQLLSGFVDFCSALCTYPPPMYRTYCAIKLKMSSVE
jgi:hypothetical protein